MSEHKDTGMTIKELTQYRKKCVSNCDNYGFYIETPMGGSFEKCPVCSHLYENMCWNDDIKYDKQISNAIISICDNKPKLKDEISVCTKCNTLFLYGCTHSVNGCTDDIYHAKILNYKNLYYIRTVSIPDNALKNGKFICSCSINFNVENKTNKTKYCSNAFYQYCSINEKYYEKCNNL